jgi:carboxypeptidase C (cathepsin A)
MRSIVALLFLLLAVVAVGCAASPHRITSLPGWTKPLTDEMYTGYLPLQDGYGSQLFYWIAMARNPAALSSNTPVILWLQGGPGCSGGLGWFLENGSDEGSG